MFCLQLQNFPQQNDQSAEVGEKKITIIIETLCWKDLLLENKIVNHRAHTKLLRESFLSDKSTLTKPANDGLYSPSVIRVELFKEPKYNQVYIKANI